jgi:hypothetical protein
MLRGILKGLAAGWIVKKISQRATRRGRSYYRAPARDRD